MKGCLDLGVAMAPRLPKVNFKVPKLALTRRGKAPAPEETPDAAAPPAPPAEAPKASMKFTPLEFRPADQAPKPRDAAPVEVAPLAPAADPAPATPAEAVPETALLEETARTAPPPPPRPEPVAPAFEPGPTVQDQPVENIEGIGPVFGEKLRSLGVATIEQLLAADADHLARQTGISANMLAKWQAMGRLQAVHGIGPQYSELLVRCDVRTLQDLARQEPEALAAKLAAYEAELGHRVQGNEVTPALAEGWIRGARAIVGEPVSTPAASEPIPESAAAPVAGPAPEPTPVPEAAPAPPPKRFGLPFGRKKEVPPAASEAPEARAVTPSRFSLGSLRKKDAAAPAPPAEATPAAAAAAPPAEKKNFGFSFGRKKAEAPAPAAEAAPAPPAEKKKLGFTLGRKKPAPEAAPPAEAAPAPPAEKKKLGFTIGRKKEPAKAASPPPAPAAPEPAPAQVAAPPEVAKAVTITLPVPAMPEPAVSQAAPEPEPAAMPAASLPEPMSAAPLLPPAMPVAVRAPMDFDYMHLRVDRILVDRTPAYRMSRLAPGPAVEAQVDALIEAKAPKARHSGGKKRSAPKAKK